MPAPVSRPHFRRSLLLAALALSLASLPLTAAPQEKIVGVATVTVTVVDQSSGRPLSAVSVRIPELGVHLVSDSAGLVRFEDIALGSYEMILSRTGYEEVEGRFTVDRDGSFQIGLKASASLQIVGTVEAQEIGSPLQGAVVRIGAMPPVVTDEAGRFRIEGVPSGRHALWVEYLGRAPESDTLILEPGELAGVVIRLEEDPIPLAGLEVIVEPRSLGLEAAGFYTRRDESGIHAVRITRWDIEQSPRHRVTDYLNNIPGVRIMSVLSPPGAIVRINRLGNRWFGLNRPPNALPGCEPTVYVDDLIHYDEAHPAPGHPRLKDMNFLPPDVIEGIEVYTGPDSAGPLRRSRLRGDPHLDSGIPVAARRAAPHPSSIATEGVDDEHASRSRPQGDHGWRSVEVYRVHHGAGIARRLLLRPDRSARPVSR